MAKQQFEMRALHRNGQVYRVKWLDFEKQEVHLLDGTIEHRRTTSAGVTMEVREHATFNEFTRFDITTPSGKNTVVALPLGEQNGKW